MSISSITARLHAILLFEAAVEIAGGREAAHITYFRQRVLPFPDEFGSMLQSDGADELARFLPRQ